jgi:hypothetical protein
LARVTAVVNALRDAFEKSEAKRMRRKLAMVDPFVNVRD